MENKIVIKYQPFSVNQLILVIKDGAVVNSFSTDIDRVNNVVNGFAKEYGITNIEMHGNADYLSKFKASLNNQFASSGYNIEIKE